ncbi:MAG: sel1 repeat family protein [Opitutaceae bacterium]|nr:sel1 repeat family protein [Opitutaceae bacterium]
MSLLSAVIARGESAAVADLIEVVHPLDATRWVGWQQSQTTDVHVLEAGKTPREWGRLDFEPAAMTTNGKRVLWVGNNQVAVGSLAGNGPIENANLAGEWHHALGNAAGFVIADYAQARFSPDGKAWRVVEAIELGENRQILAAQASEKEFALLIDAKMDADGTEYHWAQVLLSADGAQWETVFESEPQPGEPELTMLARAPDRWVVMGVGSRYDSVDGKNWEPIHGGSDNLPKLRDGDLRLGGGEWWAIDWHDRYQFSPDGRDWSAQPEALGKLPGAGAHWVLGEAGMRNLAFDQAGVLRVLTLAEVRNPPAAQRALTAVAKPAVFRGTFAPIRFVHGYYVMPGDEGRIYFSANLTDWEMVQTATPVAVTHVIHDGERWVAANKRTEAAYSVDRKTWTPYGYTNAARPEAAVWRGRYWSLHKILGVHSGFVHGRYDYAGGKDVRETMWDEQVAKPDPAFAWRGTDRLHLVDHTGRYFTSDNGDWWQAEGGMGTAKIFDVLFASGNDREVTIVNPRLDSLTMRVRTGGGIQSVAESPVKIVHGLAYGAGFFLLAGRDEWDKPTTFFRSVDGRNWTALFNWNMEPQGLVYGPAGFVANGGKGELMRYQPVAAAGSPGPRRGPTPMPEIRLRDFGSNYAGEGKRRRKVSAETPAQRRVKALVDVKSRAERGEAKAQLEMAFEVLDGQYVLFNPWRAELYFNAARQAGEATAARGYAELLRKWKPDTPAATCIELYRESAGRGDTPAIVWLALMLPPDEAHAAEIEKWRIQADARNTAFAAKWEQHEKFYAHLAAAEAGDVTAIGEVAPLLIASEAVPRDREKGVALLWRAVEQNHEGAAVYLIKAYESSYANFGANRDMRLITAEDYVRLLTKLSDAGNKNALARLVGVLMTGQLGVTRDEQKAHAKVLALAQKGDVHGMAMLGAVLMEEKSARHDEVKGREWLEKAAAAGHTGAKQWLERQAKAKP